MVFGWLKEKPRTGRGGNEFSISAVMVWCEAIVASNRKETRRHAENRMCKYGKTVGDCLNVHKEEEEKSAPNFGGQTNNGVGCGGNARWREGAERICIGTRKKRAKLALLRCLFVHKLRGV